MITNQRQYRISKAQLSKLKQAATAFDIEETTKRTGSKVLAEAELDALKSELEVLSAQLQEFDTLKSGAVNILESESLDELPSILIRARIAKGLSQRQLAEKLGLKEQQIQRYEADEYASANLSRLTEIATALGLKVKQEAKLEPRHPIQISMGKEGIEWDRFPVREMYQRNWFKGFKFRIDEIGNYPNDLLWAFLKKGRHSRQPALLRQNARLESAMNPYALLAWQCRVIILAKQAVLDNSYSRSLITEDWLRALARESRFDDGPQRAKAKLAQVGIPLVIEAHLPKTNLDGAAFLLPDGSPVIGMTLRYDRLDNFWFVLFHELIHVIKHLRKGKLADIFDELDADPDDLDAEPDKLEREANELAGDALIPKNSWEVALARYTRTEESIISFAEDLQIHPSIVAGRIRKEADDYIILNDLVGRGEVRQCFPDVQFT